MMRWLWTPALLLAACQVLIFGCSDEETTSGSGTPSGPGGSGQGAAGGGSPTGGGGQGGGSGNGWYGVCPTEGQGPPPSLKLTSVATGLNNPVYAHGAPGDTTRLYVIEQTGQIRIIENGTLLPDPFLDINQEITCCGEQGLLGLAFHPNYAENGRFFINYTAGSGNSVTAEYKRSADPNKAEPAAVKQLLDVDDQFPNHNGGNLSFGPDGFLYFGTGDGGGGGDPLESGQSLDTMLGKMLRIDVDTYPTPPPGNLEGGEPAIWDYGLRNPWRWSFDRCNGNLYIGDVGQNAWEEVNIEPAGQGKKNYGWNTTEGTHCFDPDTGCDMTGITMPILDYPHEGNGCAGTVIGGHVYRGSKIPGLVGTYFYADYCFSRVWTLRYKGGSMSDATEITDDLESGVRVISSFGEGTDGELYLTDIDAGEILRIDAE